MSKELILNIAMSLDGFIADESDGLDFLKLVEKEGEDYGHKEFLDYIETIIWGRRTYDKILSFQIEFPYKNKKCYVISKTRTGKDENVEFYNGDLKDLIISLKNKNSKHIYCDGGGNLVTELLKLNLIDRIFISIIPILLGDGIKLFNKGILQHELKLINSRKYDTGLVNLEYEVIKNQIK